MKGKYNLLFISPGEFHSYRSMIKKELVARNFEVTCIDDMIPWFPLNKVLRKVNFYLLQKLTNLYLKRELETLNINFDIVFIINGQGFSKESVGLLKSLYPNAKYIGYCWDSLINNPTPLYWYKCFDKFGIFDPVDSVKYGIPNIPLFSSIIFKDSIDKVYDISFVGTLHSDRIRLIYGALRKAKEAHSFVYFYERSILTLIRNFFRHPIYYFKLRQLIHLKPLKYEKFIAVLASSHFTLDVSHEAQNGITMRCFESVAVKTAVITNNRSLLENEIFNSSIAKVSSDFDDIDKLILNKPNLENFKKARYLQDFIDDLFN